VSEDKLEKSVLKEICDLLDSIAESETKEAAAQHISLANFKCNNIRIHLTGYTAEKLAYAFNAAKEASGKVKDKQRKLDIYNSEKYKFTRCISVI